MMKYDKDFFLVSQQVGSKSVRQCTEFYFLWKKVCIDEWRRMRVFRRRRIQDYQLRSTTDREDSKLVDDATAVLDTQVNEMTNPADFAIVTSAATEFPTCTTNAGLTVQPPAPVREKVPACRRPAPAAATATAVSGELFPCRVCGKVFDRVKSRSAHMKSHRQMEPDVHRRPPFTAYNNVAR